MFQWIVWVALARAEVPDGLRPVAAPWDAPEQYASWAAGQGRTDALACDVIWPKHVRLCFRLWEGNRRRWVTNADLAAWEVDLAAIRKAVSAQAATHLAELEVASVEGMAASYRLLRDGDGWAAAGLLDPDGLATAVGAKGVLVGMPSEGVLVAWAFGDAQVDQVMAVGVREMYDAQSGAVSSVVHLWDGGTWKPHSEAKPRGEENGADGTRTHDL